MYVPESDTEALEICRLPLGNTVKTPPGREKDVSANIIKKLLICPQAKTFSPAVGMLMPSFCQLMVGLGEPVALQGRVMGLFTITSRAAGWDSITGSSEGSGERKQRGA